MQTIDTHVSELTEHARDNARLAGPAELRRRGTQRTWRHRGSAALLGTAAVATALGLGTTLHTASTPPRTSASSSIASASLTSYQTAVLEKAHVTTATVAALAKTHVTAAQIAELEKQDLSAAQIAALAEATS